MKRKVLIVDDDHDILSMMSDLFMSYGYDTILASSGNDAISVLRKEVVQLVFSDLRMSNGNGIDVLNYVNAMNTKPIFYFLTGEPEGVLDDYLQNGVREIFSKKSNIRALLAKVLRDS